MIAEETRVVAGAAEEMDQLRSRIEGHRRVVTRNGLVARRRDVANRVDRRAALRRATLDEQRLALRSSDLVASAEHEETIVRGLLRDRVLCQRARQLVA